MTTYDPSKYKHKPSPKHTLEEVLKSLQDLIRNDLLDAKSAAAEPESAPVADDAAGGSDRVSPTLERSPAEPVAPVREDFAPTTPQSGPVNLNAVMRSLKDLIHNELDTGEEPALATDAEPETIEAPPPPLDAQHAPADADEPAPEEYTPEAFAPLDDELTLDETAAAITTPPPASALPELPGDIEQELIVEPEPEPAPAAPVIIESVSPGKTTRGTQQELPFDVPPAPAVEARLPPREPAPVSAPPSSPEPAVAAETVTPEIDNLAPATASSAEPEAALPTIEVEENFDAAAYFEIAPESATTITPEIQDAAVDTEKMTLTPEPVPPVAPPLETKTALELATEPSVENTLTMPMVDFDTVDFQSSRDEPPAPPPAGDTPSPESVPPALIAEASAPEAIPATETSAQALPAAGTRSGSDTGPVELKPQDATTPATDVATKPEAATEPASPSAPSQAPFNLDDIPVLKEVVAPPAGSALLAEPPASRTPPPRPSADRARDLVVRAVAKLNIEMRRTGGVGLDTKTILRLQQLIREELEKDGEK